MTCTSAHSTMLISTGCSARPWLHAPTLLGRSRRCRLPLRLQPHGIRELSPVYSLEKANCCQSSVASSKFGISGGRRRLGIARIRAGRNHVPPSVHISLLLVISCPPGWWRRRNGRQLLISAMLSGGFSVLIANQTTKVTLRIQFMQMSTSRSPCFGRAFSKSAGQRRNLPGGGFHQ